MAHTPLSALSNKEIDELLTATLHGPLPQETMNRVFLSLVVLKETRLSVEVLQKQLSELEDQRRWELYRSVVNGMFSANTSVHKESMQLMHQAALYYVEMVIPK